MSKISEFCLEKDEKNLHVSVFEYYLPSLHDSSLHVNYGEFDKKTRGFYPIFNWNIQPK